MAGEKLFSLLTAIVGVATIAVLVQSANTGKVILSSGVAFSDAVRAAMGK